MVTRAAADTTVDMGALKPLDPKTVDFELILAQARRPKPKPVSIFLRHDLYSDIEELDMQIDVLEAKIAGRHTFGGDEGIGDVSAVTILQAELADLIDLRNPFAEEFNASEVVFEFRIIARGDRIKAKAAMVADGHRPEDDEENEIFPCYMMAQTCTSVGWPGAQWLKFRDQVGEFPFLPLQAAFQDSGTAGMSVTAPFSRRLSPTPSNATL